ncbi:MAG: SRPBCC domain-containing protein [Bacteroidota bacterium]
MSTLPIVTKTVHIHAPESSVWNAITQPQKLQQWMSESPIIVTSEEVVGGIFSIKGKMNGAPYESKGFVLAWEPNRHFQYSYWNKISRIPDVPENYSILDFRLTSIETGTTLTFTQNNFIGKASFEHSNYYWGIALVALKRFVEGSSLIGY